MKWFIPTWNGDLRLEPYATDEDKTTLFIVSPTPHETQVLEALGKVLLEKGYVKEWNAKLSRLRRSATVVIDAPLEKLGPIVAKLMRPGKAVLTAIRFEGGKVITSSGNETELAELAEEVKKEEKAGGEKAEAAATVKRPTPCCPQCELGSVAPARETLLAFLNEEEHESWKEHRRIVVVGGLSGHRYVLAHRNTELARKIGRVCYDLDDQCVVHFHDRSVPPEEEVLAAKLVLEHREPWLRNEATLFGMVGGERYKNPFGDGMDGVESAVLTSAIGGAGLGRLLS